MDYFGNTDVLGVWADLLFSRFGLILVALVLATVALNSLTRPTRGGRSLPRYSRFHPRPSASRGWTTQTRLKPWEPLILGGGVDESIEEIKQLSPEAFEEFVADLFHRRGYAVRMVGGDGDHGVDLIVTDTNGERALVQCKRWRRKWIGEPVVRDFYGALMHDAIAARGYIVTTSFFSRAARSWAEGKPLRLIDGEELVRIAEGIVALGRAEEEMPPNVDTGG